MTIYDASILVVLYGKGLANSKTLLSLERMKFSEDSVISLTIWNNGPELLSCFDFISNLESAGFIVNIIETKENISLSKIYNKFVNGFESRKYVVLDDDSVINNDYFDSVLSLCADDVGMPIISYNNKVVNPRINKKPINNKIYNSEGGEIITIGSGLVIGSSIVQKLKRKNEFSNVFDERFYFYGVDTAFCRCLQRNNLSSCIKIIPGFNHDLSRYSVESSEKKQFRRKERSYDRGLSLRYYEPRLSSIIKILKITIAININAELKNEISLIHLLMAYIKGRHYKN